MDVFEAMEGRRSCRDFLPDPVTDDEIRRILEAACWAPSPLNGQPWEFIVVTSQRVKEKIHAEAEARRKWAREKSGWKWLDRYTVDFLKAAPVLVVITGDPKKTGVDMFFEEGGNGYQYACASAIQNMHLAAHALGLGSLWFTLFDRDVLREILDLDPGKKPIAVVCLGRPANPPAKTPRKAPEEKTTYVRD